MRIASIHVTHFLGLQSVDIACRAPVQLICGGNGAGKSSVRDAVALALTGDLGRVGLKKDAPALIRSGADLAVCEVTDADGDLHRVAINRGGKITDSRGKRDPDPVLPFVLDAQRFAHLAPTERRAFLFELIGIKTDPGEIRRRLVDRLFHKAAATDVEMGRIERVAPLLRAGFDAAAKDAKTTATQAKGAWRAVTGETWGSAKGAEWRAAVPPYDGAAQVAIAKDLKICEHALEQWQQFIGKLQAEEQRRAGLRARLPALHEHAARVDRIAAKLGADQAGLREQDEALQACQAAAGGAPRVGLVHDLARAVAFLLLGMGGDADDGGARCALDAYEREHGSTDTDRGGDAAARERLPEVKAGRDIMARAVENDRRDLAAAQQAKAEADAIAKDLAEPFDAAELAGAREQAEKLKARRAELLQQIEQQRSIKALVDGAEAKTKLAAQHHADVVAWDAIGDALSPDGIPAEMLAEALWPINNRLSQSALDAQWPRIEIAPDMTVRAALHDRPYALLSESERWRADAMLAEAIASLSGANLLVLDRFDVLDLQGRSDLLAWLDALADAGEIDTALVFGTLKAAPMGLPETVEAHWITDGVCAEKLREAA